MDYQVDFKVENYIILRNNATKSAITKIVRL